jgi:cell division protein FtsB
MPISLFCPVCSMKVEFPDRLAGKSAPCPSCRNAVNVPATGRPSLAARLALRMKTALPWLVAAVALAAFAVSHLGREKPDPDRASALERELQDLRANVKALEAKQADAAAKPSAPAPPDPDALPAPPPKPPAGGDVAALQKDLAVARETNETLQQKVQDLETEVAKLKSASPRPADPLPAIEMADDDDIEIRMDGRPDPLAPRPRILFVGTAANTGNRHAPAVQVTIRVTGFRGLDPVTRQLVTDVSYAATLTERIRSLPPGTTAPVVKDLLPSDPALLNRNVLWEPHFEVSAKVLKE